VRGCAAAAFVGGALGVAPSALAQEAGAVVGAGNLLQVFAGLALVLALVLGAAVLMGRVSRVPGLSNQAIKTVAATAVGTRERVVLLEIADTWILVGVAPGQVRSLATLPRSELPATQSAPGAGPPFAQLLRRLSERRNAT
jgi:flagellar protein FliO/FliZ